MGGPQQPLFSSSSGSSHKSNKRFMKLCDKHAAFQSFFAALFLLLLALVANSPSNESEISSSSSYDKIDAKKLMKSIQNQHGGEHEDEDAK